MPIQYYHICSLTIWVWVNLIDSIAMCGRSGCLDLNVSMCEYFYQADASCNLFWLKLQDSQFEAQIILHEWETLWETKHTQESWHSYTKGETCVTDHLLPLAGSFTFGSESCWTFRAPAIDEVGRDWIFESCYHRRETNKINQWTMPGRYCPLNLWIYHWTRT